MERLHYPKNFVFVVVVTLLSAGCQVRQPGHLETQFVQTAKRHLTIGGRSDRNPLAPNEENVRAGQRNFDSYCMVCHGLDGQNTACRSPIECHLRFRCSARLRSRPIQMASYIGSSSMVFLHLACRLPEKSSAMKKYGR